MSRFTKGMRQALTIARRDLKAMVMTPTFLLFLLSPLLMIGFGAVGSISATSAMQGGEDRQRMIAIVPPEHAGAIKAADGELRKLFTQPRPPLVIETPRGDVETQARALFGGDQTEAVAVLYGPLDKPHVLRAPGTAPEANFLAAVARQAHRAEKAGVAIPAAAPDIEVIAAGDASASGRGQAAYFAALGIFFLTLMLSGQAVGAMAEERSNKVIEVLAAAVPLESVFFGKLLGTFGSALIFIIFWGTLFAQLPKFVSGDLGNAIGSLSAAVGPAFAPLFVLYFATAYLLQSAVYLGLGSQMGSQREIQMLSLPITIFQFAMLGWASFAAGHPGSWLTLAAEIFPFSSPLAMAARAANAPELWPHALALAWQALWVAITVTVAARLFRRGVLKSGSPKRSKRPSERPAERHAIDTAVS
ncbi:ABC-2 type transport system permease protein [Sphingomonas naasensis]|uniref:ABC transporter permease n=1 Tax=Sphingomonas naasensis TaxID=1344951 RepID=A0A4S1WB05_9SPHN|nr:ABC transporter permease [Sphingomonas naasensis]NIJ19820.1 ABC-2 type transport system permease protein [Sphingomonas naasensis]TGX40048.1 ABC transporter permease [Sphingomonas naasensis]